MVKDQTQGRGIPSPSGLFPIHLIQHTVEEVKQGLEPIYPLWDGGVVVGEVGARG